MAQTKKYKPGENCEKTAKYAEYTESGKLVNEDIDVEAGNRFQPAEQRGSYFIEQK